MCPLSSKALDRSDHTPVSRKSTVSKSEWCLQLQNYHSNFGQIVRLLAVGIINSISGSECCARYVTLIFSISRREQSDRTSLGRVSMPLFSYSAWWLFNSKWMDIEYKIVFCRHQLFLQDAKCPCARDLPTPHNRARSRRLQGSLCVQKEVNWQR